MRTEVELVGTCKGINNTNAYSKDVTSIPLCISSQYGAACRLKLCHMHSDAISCRNPLKKSSRHSLKDLSTWVN